MTNFTSLHHSLKTLFFLFILCFGQSMVKASAIKTKEEKSKEEFLTQVRLREAKHYRKKVLITHIIIDSGIVLAVLVTFILGSIFKYGSNANKDIEARQTFLAIYPTAVYLFSVIINVFLLFIFRPSNLLAKQYLKRTERNGLLIDFAFLFTLLSFCISQEYKRLASLFSLPFFFKKYLMYYYIPLEKKTERKLATSVKEAHAFSSIPKGKSLTTIGK